MPETELPPQVAAQVALKVTPEIARLARQLYMDAMPLADISRRTGLSTRAIYYWADRVVADDGAVTLNPAPRRMGATKLVDRRKGAGGIRARARTGARAEPARGETGRQPAAQKRGDGAALSPMEGPERSETGGDDAALDVADAVKSGRTSSPRRQKPVRAHGGLPPRHRLLARLWRTAERQVAEIESRMWAGADREAQTTRTAADSEKDARALALIARTLRELTVAEDDASIPSGMKPDDGSAHDLDDFRRELARRLERLRTDAEDGAAVSIDPE